MLKRFLQELQTLAGDDALRKRYLVAVSGGADSTVMGSLFHEAGLTFAVAHCNFHLRGEDSDRDMHFVEKLSTLTRLSFRLPSEAQWEFAARGGNNSQDFRYSGSDYVDDVAWHKGNADGMLHPVGEKQPNELGLYDMSGNLWEWCLDTYEPYPNMPQENPVSMYGNSFVLRGGSWTYLPSYCRVTCRDSYNGDDASVSVGFRVCLLVN